MLEYIWTANLLLDDILLKVVQGRGSTHFICYLLRNDEMDNFAEQEESVATRYCIKASGSKECRLHASSAEVWCSKFSIDFLIKSSIF